MRTFALLGVLLSSAGVFAQNRVAIPPQSMVAPVRPAFQPVRPTYQMPHRFPVATNQFSITDTTFPSRLALTTGAFGVPRMERPAWVGRSGSVGVIPYAYPVFMGGGYYGDLMYQQPQQPNVTVVYPPPTPPVVINQSFGGQVPAPPPEQGEAGQTSFQVYRAPSRETAAENPTSEYYLIAFNDHSIYSAVAFYVDGDTLHYFTQGNVHNQVSLSLVDRELTERLNKDRNVSLKLPAR
jgi:hypothetical protein